MPIHDWTKVSAGTYHDFHGGWIFDLRRRLNNGILPRGFYALAEQVARNIVPDVLTLQGIGGDSSKVTSDDDSGGVAVATSPPKMAVTDSISEAVRLATRRRRLVIRHATGDRMVAVLEIVSPGNKEKRSAVNQFIDKAADVLDEGINLLVIDLFPPGTFDPDGLHGTLWRRLGGEFELPDSKPLTLASYSTGPDDIVNCYVEPTSVGAELIEMPLFLTSERYVNLPLEQSYLSAYEGFPQRWKKVLEA